MTDDTKVTPLARPSHAPNVGGHRPVTAIRSVRNAAAVSISTAGWRAAMRFRSPRSRTTRTTISTIAAEVQPRAGLAHFLTGA
jgi:hypothetical protein